MVALQVKKASPRLTAGSSKTCAFNPEILQPYKTFLCAHAVTYLCFVKDMISVSSWHTYRALPACRFWVLPLQAECCIFALLHFLFWSWSLWAHCEEFCILAFLAFDLAAFVCSLISSGLNAAAVGTGETCVIDQPDLVVHVSDGHDCTALAAGRAFWSFSAWRCLGSVLYTYFTIMISHNHIILIHLILLRFCAR